MGSVGVSTASRIVPLFVNVKIVVIQHSTESKKKNDEDQLDSEIDEEDASDEEGDDLMAEDDNDME